MKLSELLNNASGRSLRTPLVVGLVLINVVAIGGSLVWSSKVGPPLFVLPVVILLVSGALAVLVLKAARQEGVELVGHLASLLRAGDWVLKHADGESPLEDIDGLGPLTGAKGDGVQAVGRLEDWLGRLSTSTPLSLSDAGELERDLELAREFQQAYLNRPYPRIPEVHVEGRLRLDFYHRYEPALALGGDFYDILPLAPDTAGVFIADVMGHGTRSALITSILRTLLGDLHQQARNAPHFLNELNKQFSGMLHSLPSPLFASAFYFVPDTTGRVATYSSAGHPPPFLVRSHLQRITRLNVPAPRGAALGVIANEEYTGAHVRLMPGDVFIFFTDGVYEADNQEGEEFGIERIEGILQEHIYKTGREMVDAVVHAVKDFAGDEPVTDDICLVAVGVTDKAVASDTRPGT